MPSPFPPAAAAAPPLAFTALTRTLSTLALPARRRAALGQFLRHLAIGERVAQRSAAHQALLAPTAPASRFFRSQSRHEALHAHIFDLAAAALHAAPLILDDGPYAAYEARLVAAVARRDYADTVVGTQLVLEALGDILLGHLDTGLERHGLGLHRLRRLLRAQEAAHHAFGLTELAALAAASPTGRTALAGRIPPYRALAQDLIAAAAPVLHVFDLAPDDIGGELDACLARDRWT